MENVLDDRELNSQRRPALRKCACFRSSWGTCYRCGTEKRDTETGSPAPRQDLVGTFMTCGLMNVIKEWISPLPDRSLPALQIRRELLKLLMGLPIQSTQLLKDSGVARAVVFLQRHPKETQGNIDLTYHLIRKDCTPQPKREERKRRSVQLCVLTVFPFLCPDKWKRELFGASTDCQKRWKEQCERSDPEPQRRLLRASPVFCNHTIVILTHRTLKPCGSEATRPPAHCVRAQVPMQSQMVYKVRPTWNVRAKSS
ncbi:unnamed protein product, partial [Tetraodon nigroviridis]